MSIQSKLSVNPEFHEGEVALQSKLGVAELIGERTNGFIRSFMPQQHRQFFTSSPFTVFGLIDSDGHPVATPIWGEGNFIESPSPTQLRFSLNRNANYLIQQILNLDYMAGSKIGIVGIEYATRRRNRLNGTISHSVDGNMTVLVDHSFGNCPQYIHKRGTTITPRATEKGVKEGFDVYEAKQLDNAIKAMIEQAETFFIASRHNRLGDSAKEGLDVSHRGGKAGFIKVEGRRLTFPDFSGNKFFNTLGNIQLDPRVGLCFWDNESGDVIFVKANASIIWEQSQVRTFEGAERLISLDVNAVTRVASIYPFTHTITEMSPQVEKTGYWPSS